MLFRLDFVGWSLKASDANTGAITPGSEFTKDTPIPDAETEVYAVWKERQKITIRFNANGGNLGSLSESKEIYEREALGDEFPPHHPTNVGDLAELRALEEGRVLCDAGEAMEALGAAVEELYEKMEEQKLCCKM